MRLVSRLFSDYTVTMRLQGKFSAKILTRKNIIFYKEILYLLLSSVTYYCVLKLIKRGIMCEGYTAYLAWLPHIPLRKYMLCLNRLKYMRFSFLLQFHVTALGK